MSINFGSIADQVGSAFGKVVSKGQDILEDQSELASEKIPRQLILSSRVDLKLSNMNDEQTLVAIGDIDSFSSKMLIENRRFRPFGFQFHRTKQKVNGWQLGFDAKLDGYEIQYIMNAIQDLIMGSSEGSDPRNLIGFREIHSVGNSPMFTVVESYKFMDHSVLRFAYERFVFDEFDYKTPDDNQAIDVRMSGFAQRRTIRTFELSNDSVIRQIDSDITTAMNIINNRGLS